MAFEIGTANNERELIHKLDLFLTQNQSLIEQGSQWEKVYDHTITATATEYTRRHIVWRSPDLGQPQVNVAACSVNSIKADTYNLVFFTGSNFDKTSVKEPLKLHLGFVHKSPEPSLFCDNREFQYVFIANSRHFKVITRVHEVTSAVYAGFIFPSVMPHIYPMPLCIAGSRAGGYLATAQNSIPRYSLREGYNFLFPYGSYNGLVGHGGRNGQWRNFAGGNPYQREQQLYPIAYEYNEKVDFQILDDSVPFQGCSTLIPIEFIQAGEWGDVFRFGVFDGVFWTEGHGRRYGDRLRIDDRTEAFVLNNAYREDTHDFVAFTLEP